MGQSAHCMAVMVVKQAILMLQISAGRFEEDQGCAQAAATAGNNARQLQCRWFPGPHREHLTPGPAARQPGCRFTGPASGLLACKMLMCQLCKKCPHQDWGQPNGSSPRSLCPLIGSCTAPPPAIISWYGSAFCTVAGTADPQGCGNQHCLKVYKVPVDGRKECASWAGRGAPRAEPAAQTTWQTLAGEQCPASWTRPACASATGSWQVV